MDPVSPAPPLLAGARRLKPPRARGRAVAVVAVCLLRYLFTFFTFTTKTPNNGYD